MASRAVPTPSREAFFNYNNMLCNQTKFTERHMGECSTAEQAVVNRSSVVTGEHIGRYVEELSELPLPQYMQDCGKSGIE